MLEFITLKDRTPSNTEFIVSYTHSIFQDPYFDPKIQIIESGTALIPKPKR